MGLRLVYSGKKTTDYAPISSGKPPSSEMRPTSSLISQRAQAHLDVFRRLELVSPGNADLINDMAMRVLSRCEKNRAAGFTDDDTND